MSLEDMSRAAVWRRDRLPEENKRTLRKQNLIAAYKRQHLWDLLTIDERRLVPRMPSKRPKVVQKAGDAVRLSLCLSVIRQGVLGARVS